MTAYQPHLNLQTLLTKAAASLDPSLIQQAQGTYAAYNHMHDIVGGYERGDNSFGDFQRAKRAYVQAFNRLSAALDTLG